ncbi:MAG: ABC transporter substrate-binding protein [Crenarchaeota archaeon]|nr:ABC transporter substrate-binding protein [Thermoproteota archaeon]MDA1124222.1 ABC transporter substrate-binding protein [Thermoproteota archaeon]
MKQLKIFKIILIICLISIIPPAFAQKGTYVDEIKFIQYLDENTALEEVKKGNLDMYYYRISSDRLEDSESRDKLKVYESTGGYYSILLNPTDEGPFNPFSIREVRYAVNFLVDRDLIVNELLGGFGTPMFSNYGSFSAEYLRVLDVIETFQFRYNPSFAEKVITDELTIRGAEKIEGVWNYENEPIEITVFIRSDDPVRKAIGEILSSELEEIGFKVNKEFGDLNKAYVMVYGSNPAEQKWSLYTEGWGSSGFTRYDSVTLAQMYSPWFSSMPGNNNPSNWNYENKKLDELTQKIYSGEFNDKDERTSIIKEAMKEGVNESVRIFLASKIDQYVVNKEVDGIINALGAGVPSRFTPINVRTDSGTLNVGVKQIYQAAWNPIGGLGDTYSNQIWLSITDPILTGHPFSGEIMPIRSSWEVETNGIDSSVQVPNDAIKWNSDSKKWDKVGNEIFAKSKITYDLKFNQWHHGQEMDMNDIIYSVYFLSEWGSERTEDDRTYDSDFSPQASQVLNTLKGIRVMDENTIEVYTDFWHFDSGEIASWGSVWSSMPWEIMASMEQIVVDGKSSFSRTESITKNVNWLSLIIPNDANQVKMQLNTFEENEHIPNALIQFNPQNGFQNIRYNSSQEWIDENNHAVISNGPFYLDRYSPDSRTIVIKSFDYGNYVFEQGKWSDFEDVKFPSINSVEFRQPYVLGSNDEILVSTENSSEIHYFIINSEGKIILNGINEIVNGESSIKLDENSDIIEGVHTIKIFAASNDVLKPYEYSKSFIIISSDREIPKVEAISEIKETKVDYWYVLVIIPILIIIIIMIIRRSNLSANNK